MAPFPLVQAGSGGYGAASSADSPGKRDDCTRNRTRDIGVALIRFQVAKPHQRALGSAASLVDAWTTADRAEAVRVQSRKEDPQSSSRVRDMQGVPRYLVPKASFSLVSES